MTDRVVSYPPATPSTRGHSAVAGARTTTPNVEMPVWLTHLEAVVLREALAQSHSIDDLRDNFTRLYGAARGSE